MKILAFEDFKDFPLEEFPYDKAHSALGEYHHIMPEGYFGNFYDPIINNQWRTAEGSWIFTRVAGVRYLEQNRSYASFGHFGEVVPLLVHQHVNALNLSVETKVEMTSTKYLTGLAFNYVHSQKYMGVQLEDQKIVLFDKNQKDIKVLKTVPFTYVSNQFYTLKVERSSSEVNVYIDGVKQLSYQGKLKEQFGSVAFMGRNAAKHAYLKVEQSDENYKAEQKLLAEKALKLAAKKKTYAPLECIKKIDLKGFGAGRQFRIIKHGNENIYVFVQHQKKIVRDSHAQISCITAIKENGDILWQIGEPNPSFMTTTISCDLPIQIADINNDGREEIIYSQDFRVIIADALTGKEIKSMATPIVKGDPLLDEDYPFDRLNVDAIRVADFTKKGYQGDFFIKDRYKNVWAFDYEFNLLFRYNHKNTGHFPYIYDFDGDGIDEMYVGYDMTKNGKVVWSLPYNSDHTDEIIYEALKEGGEKVLILASGNEGFNVVSAKGEIIKSIPVGHAQRISLANYDSHREGREVCVTSYWGSNGILYTFDSDLNIIAEKEFMGNGNVITPINYDNSENALILSNTSPVYGGLLDVNLDVIVPFPNDGHPTLASEAYDVDGDGIDEILTWDQQSLWIYKTSKAKPKLHEYDRYPKNAFSNYRGEYLIKK